MTPDSVSVVLRACSFIALLQAAGTMLFRAIFGGQLLASRASMHRLCNGAVLAAAVLICLHHALEPARLAGEWSGVWDRELQGMVWQSAAGTVWLLRLVALVMIALGMHGASVGVMSLGVTGSLLAAISFTFTGHTHAAAGMLPAALAVHLVAVAFWFGSLLPLASVVRHELPERAAQSLAAFSRWAVWLVAALFAAGAGLLIGLLPGWSALATPYGRLALVKVATFGILMALAALNRWRYVPLLSQHAAARQYLRRTMLAEYWLICAVLSLTAVMTACCSPDDSA